VTYELLNNLRAIAADGDRIGDQDSRVIDAAADLIEQQAARIAELEATDKQRAGFDRCFEALGITDDRERSWSSLVIAINDVVERVSGLEAARIAYASEFPPDAEGLPDVGNIHANIRAMKKENERLERCTQTLASIMHNNTVAMQAAWIEWQYGEGPEGAMAWIENTLDGPGLIPESDEPFATEAQAYFDANKTELK